MTDKELEDKVELYGKPLLKKLFFELRDIYSTEGAEVSDSVFYTLLTSMITTQIVNLVMIEETPESGAETYAKQKLEVQLSVESAFTAILQQVNPGVNPEFKCSIELLATGLEPKNYC